MAVIADKPLALAANPILATYWIASTHQDHDEQALLPLSNEQITLDSRALVESPALLATPDSPEEYRAWIATVSATTENIQTNVTSDIEVVTPAKDSAPGIHAAQLANESLQNNLELPLTRNIHSQRPNSTQSQTLQQHPVEPTDTVVIENHADAEQTDRLMEQWADIAFALED